MNVIRPLVTISIEASEASIRAAQNGAPAEEALGHLEQAVVLCATAVWTCVAAGGLGVTSPEALPALTGADRRWKDAAAHIGGKEAADAVARGMLHGWEAAVEAGFFVIAI